MNRRLSINGAAFFYDYRDKQLRAKFVDPIFGALDKLVNVPKSRVWGAEMSVNAIPVEGLTLGASVTYLEATVRTYQGVTGAVTNPDTGLREAATASFAGVNLPYAPKWQYSLRADYKFPLNSNVNGFIGAGLNGQSSSIGILTVSPVDRKRYDINARALVDGNLGVETTDGHWRATVWGKNIFNKFYWSQIIQAYDSLARYTGRPAEYGVTLSYKY